MGYSSRDPFEQSRESSPCLASQRLVRGTVTVARIPQARRRGSRALFRPLSWYGKRLYRLATLTTDPRNDSEKHFALVRLGHEQPTSARERLWLLMQAVCRYAGAAKRAARTDVLREEAGALLAFARAGKSKVDHVELYVLRLSSELRPQRRRGTVIVDLQCRISAVATYRCARRPPPIRGLISSARRGPPTDLLSPTNHADMSRVLSRPSAFPLALTTVFGT